jgi:hypothetical protein
MVAVLAGCASTSSASRVPVAGQTDGSPAASPSVTAGRSRPVVTRRAPRCTRHQLAVTFGPVGAATGSVSAAVRLTNLSVRPCRLVGYLAVQRLTFSGDLLETRVVHADAGMGVFPDPGPHRFTLGPGAAASAMLGWGDSPVPTVTGRPLVSCRPSYLLRVRLPDRDRGVIIATGKPSGPLAANRINACRGRLTLTALQDQPSPRRM